jgi:hypothetical protein
VPATLVSLVEEAVAAPVIGDATGLLADLRADLDHAASHATATIADADLPLRLPKDRIARVLACEHQSLLTSAHELNEPVVRGRVLDRLLHHHVHGGGAPAAGPALAVAEGAFEAERDDTVLEWLLEDPPTRERVAADATAFVERLDQLGHPDPAWWPRCEDRLRVDLAGGRVVCTARLDLVVGGAPTEHPMVVVEAKSGRFGQDNRDGLFWYALLAALRHGRPPAAVVGWSAFDGVGWCQPVGEPVLRAAASRAVDALDRIGEIVRGRAAVRSACRACTWCAERSTCPSAAVDDDDG